MNIFEIIIISIGLAMDAFAISLCKGLSLKKLSYKKSLLVGLYFGIFQAIMPLIGYYFAYNFINVIEKYDHWIAFFLLLFIGIKMIKDSILKEDVLDDDTSIKKMIPLSIATSIDALAIGISLSFLKVNIISSALYIGIITFILSFIGVLIGNKVKNRFGNNAELLGGFMLIVIGFKILFEHLNII